MSQERIVCDPKIMMGKPVVRGTRVTVEAILRLLGRKHALAEILDAYPDLAEDDIQAAQTFAAEFLASERVLAGLRFA